MVRVLPEGPIDKTFDYLVPDALAGAVTVGTRVRVMLHGRRVGGWVVAADVRPPAGMKLQPLAKVSSIGPPAELVELAHWAAWRWAGRPAALLASASAPVNVARLPVRQAGPAPAVTVGDEAAEAWTMAAARGGCVVVRAAPSTDLHPLLVRATGAGPILVILPSVAAARTAAVRLRRTGAPVALHPRDWALGASGATVVGARGAAWAPVGDLAGIVVVDEHDEAMQEERAPTWHARDVAVERARRAGVPCVLVSPCPTLEALDHGPLLTLSRQHERAGWPALEIVDQRRLDPLREGRHSEALVRVLRSDARVVCVLNRKGRARLLACSACGELARCERCHAAVTQAQDALTCPRCGATRPVVCARCGSTRLKSLRPGVTRVREELSALAGEDVVEVTGDTSELTRDARVLVGTEAVLHQATDADVVAFLEFDQELLAARYRAGEQALSLLARAARVVGGRRPGSRILVQTRVPNHEVLAAALHADPRRLSDPEAERRAALRFPPATALASVSGAAAAAFVDTIAALERPGVELLGPAAGAWLVRAADHQILCDALAAAPRPPGRLRIEVDPLRV